MIWRSTYAFVSALVVCIVLTFANQMPDFDLWSRLQVGTAVWQLGHPLWQDVFSYAPTKLLWVDHEWGASLVFYACARAFGDAGIFAVKGLLLAATFAGVVRAIAVRTSRRPGLLWLSLLGFALWPGVGSLVRSQAFTYALFALWIWGAEKLRAGRGRVLWVFPVTMLAWANLHGGFLAGLGLLALYGVGEALQRRPVRLFALAIGLSIPVTLINPYGVELWRYMAEAATMPRPDVREWAPMWGSSWRVFPGALVLAGLVALATARVAIRRRPADWTRLVVLGGLATVAVMHQRHLVFFTIAAGALVFRDVDGLLDRARAKIAASWRGAAAVTTTAAFAAAALWFVAPRLSSEMRVPAHAYPVGSVAFIRDNGISGNLAVPFDWGSYASWNLYPQCRVLIDGRYEEVYPHEVAKAAIDFTLRRGDWRAAIDQHRTDVMILPLATYGLSGVRAFTGWRPVFFDAISAVLVPENSARDGYAQPAMGATQRSP